MRRVSPDVCRCIRRILPAYCRTLPPAWRDRPGPRLPHPPPPDDAGSCAQSPGGFAGAEIFNLRERLAVAQAQGSQDPDVECRVVRDHASAPQDFEEMRRNAGEFRRTGNHPRRDAVDLYIERTEPAAGLMRQDELFLSVNGDPVFEDGDADGACAGAVAVGRFEIQTDERHAESVRRARSFFRWDGRPAVSPAEERSPPCRPGAHRGSAPA